MAGGDGRYVVKTALAGHLLEPSLRPLIEKCVDYVSIVSHRGSLLINGYLLHRLDAGLPLPHLDATSLERLTRQAFVTDGTKRSPVAGFFEFLAAEGHRYPAAPASKPLSAMKALTDYAAGQYARNFATYLRTTMRARQRRYIEAWSREQQQPDDSRDAAILLSRINSWPSRTSYVLTQQQTQFVEEERQALGMEDGSYLSDTWMDGHLTRVISYHHRMLRAVEDAGDDAGRRWTLAPIHAIRSLMIHVDTRVLYALLKAAGKFDKNYAKFAEMKEDHWGSVFEFKPRKKPAYYVQTDGVSLCTHYLRRNAPAAKQKRGGGTKRKRKSEEKVAEAPPVDPGDRVIAIDPGRVNLVYGVEQLPEGGTKTYTLTRRAYYHGGHIFKARRHTQRWNRAIQDELDALAAASPKTSHTAAWHEYLAAVQQTYDALWGHLCRRRCGRMRLETHIYKQKTLDTFLASMKPRRQPVPKIAYGAARVASGGAGELSVPCVEVYKRISKLYPTTPVDEFRSTKCCYACASNGLTSELAGMRRQRRGGEPGLQDNRGLRRCTTCRKCPLVSRDMNAALNIDLCFRLGPLHRPSALSRN